MRTRLLAFICAFASSLHAAPQSLIRSQTASSARVQSPEVVRKTFEPWLQAVGALVSRTKDAEVDFYLQVLRNAALMIPAAEGGPNVLAQRVLAPPPLSARPWIGVIVIESNENLPAGRWQQLASATDFAAEYHEDTNTIYLRSDIPQIPIIRGLLVVHEMRHWWQAAHSRSTEDPDSRLRKEADAYETEFRILDALLLPRYHELLGSERLRIRRLLTDPKQPPLQPDWNSPLLEQAFGRIESPIAKQLVAAEIAVRAAMAELDTMPSGSALRRKLDLLRSLGYQ